VQSSLIRSPRIGEEREGKIYPAKTPVKVLDSNILKVQLLKIIEQQQLNSKNFHNNSSLIKDSDTTASMMGRENTKLQDEDSMLLKWERD
jgi:hypothetical protein